MYSQSVNIIAGNMWTDPLPVIPGQRMNILLHPDASADMTIVLQCRYRKEAEWYNVKSWVYSGSGNADIVETTDHPEPELIQYRLGCPTGDWSAGTCVVRLGTGGRVL